MNNLIPSLHLVVRQKQRGIRPADVSLVHSIAKEFIPGRFWLSNQDANLEIAARRNRIMQLERSGTEQAQREIRVLQNEIARIDSLRGWLVVAEGERGITVYYHERRPRRPARRRTVQSRRRRQ